MAVITKDTHEGYEISGSPKTVTEERVYLFSGGLRQELGWPRKNIHTDLEFAKSRGLPTRVASGAMFEGYLTELMIDLFGINWLRDGKMNLTFIAIVNTGDTLVPKAVVQSRRVESSGVRFIMEVWCENQLGKKVVVGTSTGLLR